MVEEKYVRLHSVFNSEIRKVAIEQMSTDGANCITSIEAISEDEAVVNFFISVFEEKQKGKRVRLRSKRRFAANRVIRILDNNQLLPEKYLTRKAFDGIEPTVAVPSLWRAGIVISYKVPKEIVDKFVMLMDIDKESFAYSISRWA